VTRAILPTLVAAIVLAIAGPARADDNEPTDPTAKAHLAAGSAAYKAGDFAAAAREFEAGFTVEPWPKFLFAWAQAVRRGGDCDASVALYRRYLATGPALSARRLAEDGLVACGAPIDPPPPPEPVVAPLTEPGTDAPVRDRPPAKPRGFPHKLALALGITGLVAGGVGIGFYVSSRSAADDASDAPDHDAALVHLRRSRDRLLVARIAGVASLALVAAGTVRFVLYKPRANVELSIAPTGQLVLAGSF
jgi:hypothetical protein